MKKIFLLFISLTVLLLLSYGIAESQTKNATFDGVSYEIKLSEASAVLGGFPVQFLPTTYDGDSSSYPYYFDPTTEVITYSSEMKKIGSTYYNDYFLLVAGALDDYGEVSIDFGNIDFDGNGIDDICETDKAFSSAVTGNWYSYTGEGGGLSGTMSRNAGQQQGSYTFSIDNTEFGSISVSGTFYSGIGTGIISYTPSDNSIGLTFSTIWDFETPSPPLVTTYEIIDQDQLIVNSIEGILPTTTFERDGNTYSANVQLIDGEFTTFWPDFQNWFVTITDNNDSDNDGIPDLSDTSPIISTNPGLLAVSLKPGVTDYNNSFTVWNSSYGEINYTISTDVDWLTLTPESGIATSEEDTITVDYDTTGLSEGVHRATITISDPEAGNSPFEIPVTMAVGDRDPVYRFFNKPIGSAHFYTSSAAERDVVISTYPDVFELEGIAWYAHLDNSEYPDAKPVYRFLNKTLGSVHFYTISETEKDAVVDLYPDVFQYEGIAYYAYAPGDQPEDAKPVYRFLNLTLGSAHFYTISEAEKDAVIANFPDVFEFEGIAYYAFDDPSSN